MGAIVLEFPGLSKQTLGHAAKDGKLSPAMISDDESVRIFDRLIAIPRSRSRTSSARIYVADFK